MPDGTFHVLSFGGSGSKALADPRDAVMSVVELAPVDQGLLDARYGPLADRLTTI